MKNDAKLTREKALQIVRKYLTDQMMQDIEIWDGIPDGYFIYSVPKDEPVWTARIPGPCGRLDGDQYICVSKKTGIIIHIGPLIRY